MNARRAGGLAIAAVALACHQAPRTTEITPPANRETIRNLPNWYLKPPTDNNFLFGPATAVSRDVQIAINKAQAEGRNASRRSSRSSTAP